MECCEKNQVWNTVSKRMSERLVWFLNTQRTGIPWGIIFAGFFVFLHGQCYVDSVIRLLPFFAADNQSMTIEMCKRLCLTKNHLFAGAQSRAQCYCGDVEPSPGFKSSPQGLCSWPCLGDSNQVCGGDWRVNVYQHFGEYEYQPNFTL